MGSYLLEADSEEEARVIAEDAPLPDEHSYVQGSFEIDSVEAVTMHGPKQVTDALRDSLSEILEEPGLMIPEELRKAGIEACKAHERTLARREHA
jgi:hypothetical protein